MSAIVPVRIEIRARLATAWARACCAGRRVLGPERAERWARAGMWRLSRYRINGGPWLRFTDAERARVGVVGR